jgi:hypothetical protein
MIRFSNCVIHLINFSLLNNVQGVHRNLPVSVLLQVIGNLEQPIEVQKF